jgi:hypothetical protein
MLQGKITTRALHECIPLGRYSMMKERLEQHNADKTTTGQVCQQYFSRRHSNNITL